MPLRPRTSPLFALALGACSPAPAGTDASSGPSGSSASSGSSAALTDPTTGATSTTTTSVAPTTDATTQTSDTTSPTSDATAQTSGAATQSSSSTGATTDAPGPGASLRFHGAGVAAPGQDRVKIRVDDPDTDAPGPPADIGATDFTIELWLRGALADNPSGPVACGDNLAWIYGNILVDRDRFNQDRKWGVSIAGGEVVWGVSGEGTGDRTLCSGVTVLDGAWHHLAVQRRRSDGRLWIFVDGQRRAEGPGPGGDVSYPDAGVPGDFCGGPCVGSDPFLVIAAEKHDAGPDYPSFAGDVDELRLSTVLRYQDDFTPPAAPFVADPDTAALYHFDEGQGLVAGDSSQALGGPSDGVLHVGGDPPGPEWREDSPF